MIFLDILKYSIRYNNNTIVMTLLQIEFDNICVDDLEIVQK